MTKPEIEHWPVETPEGKFVYQRRVVRQANGEIASAHTTEGRREGKPIGDPELQLVLSRFGDGRRM
jgi:hypothetical protein